MTSAPALKIKLQIMCGDEIAMGPGKADLLEAIAREGSISAAARTMDMSYRRAWLLVDVMNRCWRKPLVVTLGGGTGGKGAQVTPFGEEILQHYRMLQKLASRSGKGGDWDALAGGLLAKPRKAKRTG